MEYCKQGAHPSLTAYEYEGQTWCLEHPPPPGPIDPIRRGWCAVLPPHLGLLREPAFDGKYLCHKHYGWMLEHFYKRGEYGR